MAKRLRSRFDVQIIVLIVLIVLMVLMVLTACKEQIDRIKALEIGVNDHMVKPYDPKELALRVCNIRGHSGDM
ncbi:MAG: hypothetical protein JKY92_02125 [Magnetovibrio sp.]|nr:hypothetical protein [Magnetovibrio sp.]